MTGSLKDRITESPAAHDPARAGAMLADLVADAREEACAARLAELAVDPRVRPLLLGIFGCSPYLTGLVRRDPARVVRLLDTPPEERMAALAGELDAAVAAATSLPDAMRALRVYKSEMALLIALCDLGGVWPVMQATAAITEAADRTCAAAIRFLFAQAKARGDWTGEGKSGAPEAGSGYIVLAMGKHGARELNYSSDIDLIVFFEPELVRLKPGIEPTGFFVRMTRDLVKLMQERTADGYVFRTDLRLRPDPGATQVAIATPAALNYYESFGQNWERAALIKARAIAGDIEAGRAFIKELAPFIWRKYLDFAAIADIHAMKRQIHAVKGFGDIGVAGHNIKLGRGGIREIEFFVQTQQLIAGGRQTDLRIPDTLGALERLEARGWIKPGVRADLTECYLFLRRIEHRLQMLADEQTQTLPDDAEDLERLAHFCGYSSVSDETRNTSLPSPLTGEGLGMGVVHGGIDRLGTPPTPGPSPARGEGREQDEPGAGSPRTATAAFSKALVAHLQRVQSHYAVLFEASPELTSSGANMVFAGEADDPATVKALAAMGYERPSDAIAAVRGWHHGRYAAVRTPRARELLTEVQPLLIEALAKTTDPDLAFHGFDRFLAGLPSGVQLFSLLKQNPTLLRLVADIMGSAPRLARILGRRRRVLDAVLDPGFFGTTPDAAALARIVRGEIEAIEDTQDALDRARVIGSEQQFLIGVRVLSGTIEAAHAGGAYADLAEQLIQAMQARVEADLKKAHGRVVGGGAVVVAMGKLGGREMTAASDLDLIVIYDFDGAVTQSDGARPLAPSQYYARLTQRLVSALSAPTAEGELYEVDMRLRPSGQKGPVAVQLSSFVHYQASEAWTWEHMALTRARVVSGPPGLRAKVEAAIRAVLTRPRDRAKITGDVREMRGLIEKEKGSTDIWELKQVRGGLVDMEFIAQYLQLVSAAAMPAVLHQNTIQALRELAAAGALAQDDAEALIPSARLVNGLTQVLRLCLDGPFDPAKAPDGLKDLLARVGEVPSFEVLEATLRETLADVAATFERVVA